VDVVRVAQRHVAVLLAIHPALDIEAAQAGPDRPR
jgi:hypothetical protein